MANTYDSLQYPYDSFMFRDNDLTASTRITVSGSTVGSNISDSASGSTSAAPASNLGDLWIRNFIRSENWKPKTTGFTIDGKTGYVEFNNLTLYGGNINYGKTSFTDSANSGYWISSSGIYIGAASDATYLKYDISSATFNLKATIKRTSDGAVCLDSLGDIINSNLNTSTQKILTDFTFTDIDYAGALKTGTVEWNTTTGRVSGGTGIVINDKGIMGALDGTEKFTLLTDGTATFAGSLSAATGTFAGTVQAGAIIVGTAAGLIETGATSRLPSDENLVGYWAFDEGEGTKAYDGSGNGNDGTLTNMTSADWVDGVAGGCLDFDGTDDYVKLPNVDALKPTNAISLSLWAYWEESPLTVSYIFLVGKDVSSGYMISVNFKNQVNFAIWGASGKTAVTYSSSIKTLYHFVMTYESGVGGKVYVNGNEIGSFLDKGDIVYTEDYGTSPTIASHGGIFFFSGKIDEVRIYNTALTAEEVYALYKNPSGQPSLAVPLGRITSGSIVSKQINLSFTEGEGDCYIAAGKTDFDHDETGFIMGIDDSDSNKVKLIIGTPTEYLMVDGNTMYNTLIMKYTAKTGNVPLLLSGGHYTQTTSQTYTKIKEMTIGRKGDYNVYWGVYASVLAPNYCNFSLRVQKYNQSTLTYGSETEVENKQVTAGSRSSTTYSFTDLDYKDKIYVYGKCQNAPGSGESAIASYFDLYVDRSNEIIPSAYNLI